MEIRRALSVNLDHVATLRQVRGTSYPDPVQAATFCELAGAAGITLHLRGDRRHIQDRDLELMLRVTTLPVTLEMAPSDAMVELAARLHPRTATLVPERPMELTTEGGLDARGLAGSLKGVVERLHGSGLGVTLFLEPDEEQIRAARDLGCEAVEIHTGRYAILADEGKESDTLAELQRIEKAVDRGLSLGLRMNVGHGLHYRNVQPLAEMSGISEFSIGHGIVSRAIFTGLEEAVREMVRLLQPGR